MPITKTADELPPLGQYVLVHVPDQPWLDSGDQDGVFWAVAKRVTNHHSYGNNQRDYHYSPFGPDSFDGQEVTEWCPLPHRAPDERTKAVGYLRAQAVEYEGLFVGTAADVIDKLAAAIERGDHLKPPDERGS